MPTTPTPLDTTLESAANVPAPALNEAHAHASSTGLSLAEALVDLNLTEERPLYEVVARTLDKKLTDLETLFPRIDPTVVRSVPTGYQQRKRVIPIAREEGTLWIASSDPEARVLDLADALDCERTKLLLVTPTDLRRLRWACDLDQLRGTSAETVARALSTSAADADLLAQDPQAESRHSSLLDALLVDAVADRASDIHLERYAGRVRVRLRIDGDLHDVDRYGLSPHDALGVVNVLKVRGGLDISERRRPQGGRFSARVGGHSLDLRLQTLPSLHGEGVVVRLLPQDKEKFELATLGFSASLEDSFRRALARPSGLVLVVGPTGSGKTTSLYAGLQVLARDARRKVITVEDPIEYSVAGVHQTQVQPAIGYHFATAMRSFVRHDPDVIFVGEIRDPETAIEATRASQTGHLVLSTLHANDAVDAIQRLFDLGLHPNSIAAELRGVFAQRLVPRICAACRTPHTPDKALLRELFPKGAPEGLRFHRGAGCDRCRGRGHFGRIAVAESLISTRDLRLAIAHHKPLDELREVSEAAGLRPLREHVLELVGDGVVSVEDVVRGFPVELLVAGE